MINDTPRGLVAQITQSKEIAIVVAERLIFESKVEPWRLQIWPIKGDLHVVTMLQSVQKPA